MTHARKMSLDLRPPMLDDLGLVPALFWHIEHYTAQTQVRVSFKHSGVEGRRFEPEVETAAYRIVQEGLTNVAKHAAVDEATVRIWTQHLMLNIQIEDQGKGFAVEKVVTPAVWRACVSARNFWAGSFLLSPLPARALASRPS